MTDLLHIKARVAEASDRIKRFSFTAQLGNVESMRIVDDARRELAAAEQELTDKKEIKNG